MKTLQIGLLGDRNEAVPAHRAIPAALALAAAALGAAEGGPVSVAAVWLPTETLAGLEPDPLAARLSALHGIWCVPNGP